MAATLALCAQSGGRLRAHPAAGARAACAAASVPLLVLPVGATVSGLALTRSASSACRSPVSLALVLLLGAAARDRGAPPAGPAARPRPRLAASSWAAPGRPWRSLVALVLLTPLLQFDGFATVLGDNGDAHLAAGSAELLQHDDPAAETTRPAGRPHAAGVAVEVPDLLRPGRRLLAVGPRPGPDASSVIAVLAALAAVGFFLLARHVLPRPRPPRCWRMVLVGLDRLVLHLALDPFYNQLWALLALAVHAAVRLGVRQERQPRAQLRAGRALRPAVGARVPAARSVPGRLHRGGRSPSLAEAASMGSGPAGCRLTRCPASGAAGAGGFCGRPWPRSRCSWRSSSSRRPPRRAGPRFEAVLPGGDLGPWGGPGSCLRCRSATSWDCRSGSTSCRSGCWPLTLVGLRRSPREGAVPLGAMIAALLLAAGWLQLRGGHSSSSRRSASSGRRPCSSPASAWPR